MSGARLDGACDIASRRAALAEAETCRRVLAKTGDSVVTAVTGGGAAPEAWTHYPPGDVFDAEFQTQYYFHRHDLAGGEGSEEAGHFHLFMAPAGLPLGAQPVAGPPAGHCHLIALSVDAQGQPLRWFATNRWVTGESLYPAEAVMPAVASFAVDHTRPCWALNRWLTAMVAAFVPAIEAVLADRDRELARLAAGYDDPAAVYEDQAIEILASRAVELTARAENLRR